MLKLHKIVNALCSRILARGILQVWSSSDFRTIRSCEHHQAANDVKSRLTLAAANALDMMMQTL